MMKTRQFLLFLSFLVTAIGCSTSRTISPTIDAPVREGLSLQKPLLVTIYDGRTGTDNNEDEVEALKTSLSRIYGDNVEWIPYFETVPEDRVAMRVRIQTLGSEFGSRIISSSAYLNAVESARVNASGEWGTVVANATSNTNIHTGAIAAEGWWIGSAWIDIEVEDRRNAEPVLFSYPIVSETRESNLWGYMSGDRAAKKAWETASNQLLRSMDFVMRTVRDQEN